MLAQRETLWWPPQQVPAQPPPVCTRDGVSEGTMMRKLGGGHPISGVLTPHPPVPLCMEQLGIAGGMGVHKGGTQVSPTKKSMITFGKQLDIRASSFLPSSPLNGCHGGCQCRAHPSPVRTHQAVGEQSQAQAAGQRSPRVAWG